MHLLNEIQEIGPFSCTPLPAIRHQVEPAGSGAGHPLTAPETRPEVIRLCTMRKKINTGMDRSIEPAMIAPQSVPRFACWKERSQTGRVSDSGRDITTRASTNSFQAWMKPNTPVEISPGAISGKVTRTKAPSLVHPS